MEYTATFGIDGDCMQETREISANSYQDAYRQAMDLAGNIADDYSSNPNPSFRTVHLLSLNPDDASLEERMRAERSE